MRVHARYWYLCFSCAFVHWPSPFVSRIAALFITLPFFIPGLTKPSSVNIVERFAFILLSKAGTHRRFRYDPNISHWHFSLNRLFGLGSCCLFHCARHSHRNRATTIRCKIAYKGRRVNVVGTMRVQYFVVLIVVACMLGSRSLLIYIWKRMV